MKYSNHDVLKFALKVIKPFKLWVWGVLTINCIWAINTSINPYILRTLLNRLQGLEPKNVVSTLSGPLVAYICMVIFIFLVSRVYSYCYLKLKAPLRAYINEVLIQQTLNHAHPFFQNHFSGSLANKIRDVMDGIPDLLEIIIDYFLSSVFVILIALVTISTVSIQFGISMGCWIIFVLWISMQFSKKMTSASRIAAEVRSKIVGNMVDTLGNMMSVRLFRRKYTESSRSKQTLKEYIQADQNRQWQLLYMFSFLGGFWMLYQLISMYFLITGFIKGFVTAGDFALIFAINISIFECLWSISTQVAIFSERLGSVRQGLEVLMTPHELLDVPEAKALQLTQGTLEFKHVSYNYPGVDPLFNDVCIKIPAGQKVGLVGYSGGGKSTFVNLILRLYDVTAGAILIDGQDIKKITQDSLHHVIGLIPQEASLFYRSLLENIRYGKETATDAEVFDAAKKAYAAEFIEQLPQKYDTLVAERGVKLSGGQRQRIAIARAILKDAPILILDEATSQLDSVTENLIQASLWELMQGKTTLVIAHRLSTLLRMDRILVIDQGRITEDGTHAELIAKQGLYATLWNAQVGGLLPQEVLNNLNHKTECEI